MTTKTNTNPFETRTCPRCDGLGRYSYNPMTGSTCFKCNGRGWVYTKKGWAAYQWYDAQLTIPYREIEPGTKIRNAFGSGWSTVTDHDREAMVLYFGPNDRLDYSRTPNGTARRKPVNNDEWQDLVDRAVEYQNSL